MSQRVRLPIALTVAGSDSGGGAGLQADLRTFRDLDVHGCTVVTCLTAQNPVSVTAVEPVSPRFVTAQLDAVWAELPPRAAKTGMLFNAPIIRAVAEHWRQHPKIPLVVDPVMIATSGAALLQPAAQRALRDQLLPLATLITPNLDEAAALLGRELRTVDDLRAAARELHTRFGTSVLAKGGHLRGVPEAVDILWNGRDELLLSAPFIRGVATHGTGCTYAAAITAGLAQGLKLENAVIRAKAYLTGAIHQSRRIGRHTVLYRPPAA
jgi:hydroxymethylpyrimidine/phosphomethylpyrimidine kinase